MEPVGLIVGALIGLLLGGVVTWLALQLKFSKSRASLEAELSLSAQRLEDYRSFQEQSIQKLSETFDSLASDALNKSNQSFLQLANENFSTKLAEARGDLERRRQAIDDLIKPLSENIQKIEKERQESYGGLTQLVQEMHKSQNKLEAETRNLTQALRTPQIRGRWGEMTLRRVVELAGMSPHCDFEEQSSFSSNGHALRPDMIVRLPDDRVIAVDAKTPLDAYLNSIDTESDEDRKMALKNHARQVGDRVRELSRKSYWSSIEHTPEFVVMFLPGEFLLAPALEENPGLMERAMGQGVLIATPTTLISILLGAAYGWKQEQLAENAREISELGKEMYDRLAVWADHMVKLRQSLQRSVDVFNESVGSLEHRVMVSARRFKQSGISTEKEIPPLEPIDLALRPVAASSDDDESPDHMDGLQDSTKQG
jgi:DNA recombination protein RmuC